MYPLKRQVRQLHTSHRILAGHSHFRNIMHRKAAQDSKKMAAFTKVAAQITTAVRGTHQRILRSIKSSIKIHIRAY